MNFKASKETEEEIERRELVKNLVERKYGPFPGAGGAGRILFEGSLKAQPVEWLRAAVASAAAEEIRRKQNRRAPERIL